MLRYRVRHCLAVGSLLVLGLFTLGASPALLEVIDRLNALEAESAAFQQQLDSVQAESDAQPIVVDANGNMLGEVAGGSVVQPVVILQFEGLPLFALRISRLKFGGTQGELRFASTDCSGTPLLIPTNTGRIFPDLFARQVPGGAVYLAPNSGENMNLGSLLSDGTGACVQINHTSTVGPAILVPQMSQFTPPFEVVTRGEFLAM